MKNLPTILTALFFLFITGFTADADDFDDVLKGDFSKQQTVKIRFEVNKRLYSFEAGKFKLEKIKKNRDRIREITDKIVPWSIMEHLEPEEVARIIVYMYHAEEAGAPFEDAEDLIPLVAKVDIPIREFVLMVQYNRETKNAGIPEEIRHAFLGIAVQQKWDGVSILAGGRGLIVARLSGLNVNKAATLLLKKIPANGAGTRGGVLVSAIKDALGESANRRDARKIMENLDSTHKAVVSQENSPDGVKKIMRDAAKAESEISKAGKARIPEKPRADKKIDSEPGVVPEIITRPSSNWEILRQGSLISTVKPWLGTPYKFGNKSGRGGIDCSGFTRIVLVDQRIGVPPQEIGHGTVNQVKAGTAVSRSRLLPGDLVFFSASPDRSKITHVGLMITPTIFSHASSSKGVIYDTLSKKYWSKRYVKARRIFSNVMK